jgi:hypothetical protein
MLMVAWREITSGDSGFNFVISWNGKIKAYRSEIGSLKSNLKFGLRQIFMELGFGYQGSAGQENGKWYNGRQAFSGSNGLRNLAKLSVSVKREMWQKKNRKVLNPIFGLLTSVFKSCLCRCG